MAERKIRVGVSGHDLKFWYPLQRVLEATGRYEFREDVWISHDAHDPDRSQSLLAWAEVLVAEWALGNAVYYSKRKLPHQRLIVRFHLQERETRFPGEIEYGNVDSMVFVGPHIMRECVDKFSMPPEICSVVGNFVDCDKYALSKTDDAKYTLGMIGIVPSRKRLDRALDLLEVLLRKDERYVLRIKGASPASFPWLWRNEADRDYYRTLFSRINSGHLRYKVIFDPPADDVNQWLRMVGTILSPSDFESFHMAVAEGAASGALPVVWEWDGAKELYPELELVQDTTAAAEQIEAFAAGRLPVDLKVVRKAIRERCGSERLLGAWDGLFSDNDGRRHVRHAASSQVVDTGHAAADAHGKRRGATGEKSLRELKVALICDEFTYNSFKHEFTPLVLEPDNWRDALEREGPPDLFFCESAWSGVDSHRRPWRGRVYSSKNFKKENRGDLLGILAYCKEWKIPTVFWNKEDPTHYDDKVHNFVDTARLFDVVFTTDIDCVERYKSDYGLKNVHCLPFATQPRIFNPIAAGVRSDKVVFAGSWYANHVDRCQSMAQIFKTIVDSGYEPEIYDRYYGDKDPNHVFPEEYRQYLHPAVAHSEIARVYKSSVFGLNMNTVTASTTMFARRVFELMSCNTLCLSNYSQGMERMFGDKVVFIDRDSEALGRLTPEEIERKREAALVEVLKKHTYRQRFKFIATKAGVSFVDRDAELTVAFVVDSEEAAEEAIAYFNRQIAQLGTAKPLLILSKTIADVDLQQYYMKYNRYGVTACSQGYLETYADPARLTSLVRTRHVALMNFRKGVAADHIANAFLHTEYIDDAIIVIGGGEKYRYTDRAIVEDVIAEASLFPVLLRSYQRELRFKFYPV